MRRTKAQRRAWWYSLTDEERYAYIGKKQTIKAKNRVSYPQNESNCPIFPVITSENREDWQELILKKNPWLDESVFESPLHGCSDLDADWMTHMNSIQQELKAATV